MVVATTEEFNNNGASLDDDWDSLSMQVACKSAADGMYDLVDRFGISSFESGQISSNC